MKNDPLSVKVRRWRKTGRGRVVSGEPRVGRRSCPSLPTHAGPGAGTSDMSPHERMELMKGVPRGQSSRSYVTLDGGWQGIQMGERGTEDLHTDRDRAINQS